MSCPDCFSGRIREGKPLGKVIELHGLETYVTEPPASGRQANGALIIIPDAFGMEFINVRLLADSYAQKGGYKVYAPDFMRGHSCSLYLLEAMANVMSPTNSWLTKLYHIFWGAWTFIPWRIYNRPSRTFPVVKKFFEDFRREQQPQSLGAAGFCWGGKHVLLLSHRENFGTNGKSLLDAGFVGHPSFLHLPQDATRIAAPISWALADKDHQVKVPQQSDIISKIVTQEKPEEAKGEVKIYPGCRHGFCVRTDVLAGDADGFKSQATEAEDQAIEWFNAKLRG